MHERILKAALKRGIISQTQLSECLKNPEPLDFAVSQGILSEEEIDGLKLMQSLDAGDATPLPAYSPGFWDDVRGKSFGRYELLQKIGEGATALVIKALDPALGREVAIKVLKESGTASPQTIQRFQREARATAALRHPNIIGVHEVGQIQGWHFLSTDYISGPSFPACLADRKFSREELLSLLEKIARACHYAHAAGIVHRDLKPENILLDEQRNPYVSDFGLARFATGEMSVTVTGTIMGTPNYMSPEHLSGHPETVDARSDVFSLGIILYEAFTGRLPFEGDSITAVYAAIEASDPPRPRNVNHALNLDDEAVIMKAIDRNPARRYATAEELADDLSNLRMGRPVLATRLNTVRLMARRALKYRLWIAAGVGLALGAAGLSMFFSSRQESDRETLQATHDAIERTNNALNDLDKALLSPPSDLTPFYRTIDQQIQELAALILKPEFSDTARLHFELGRALRSRGRYLEAIEAFRKAERSPSIAGAAHFEHGQAAIDEYFQRLRIVSATATMEERRKFSEDNKLLLAQAQEQFEKVSGKDELSSKQIEFAQAFTLVLKGNYEEADARFEKLLKTFVRGKDQKLHSDTLIAQGYGRYFRRDFALAIQSFERALDLLRSQFSAHLACGECHFQLLVANLVTGEEADGELKKAMSHFKDVEIILPASLACQIGIGNALTMGMRRKGEIDEKTYEQAIAAFDKAIANAATSALAISNKADLVSFRLYAGAKKGLFDEALAEKTLGELRGVLEKNPRMESARAVLASIESSWLRNKYHLGKWDEKLFEEILASLEKGLSLNPSHDGFHYELALTCNLKQEYLGRQYKFEDALFDRAIQHADKARELSPQKALPYVEMATAHNLRLNRGLWQNQFSEEDWDKARHHLEVALALDPNCTAALFNLGNLCCRRLASAYSDDVFDEGESMIRRGLDLTPDHAIGWNSLGTIYYSKFVKDAQGPDDPISEKALSAFDSALKFFPRYTEAANNRGTVFLTRVALALDHRQFREKDWNEANAAFRQALEFDPKNGNAYLNLAFMNDRVAIHLLDRKLDASKPLALALEAFAKASEMVPNYPALRLRWGRTLARKFESSAAPDPAEARKAEDLLSGEIEKNRQDALALYERGLLRKALHRPQPAIDDFSEALRIAPGDARLLEPLIEACKKELKGEY